MALVTQPSMNPEAVNYKHQNGVSEAKRNAEALFESKTVAEIREIEGRTRKDIELKKHQLRQLVGDSYRDLIGSADKIVGIAHNCDLILSNIKAIQGGFSSLAHSFTSADTLLNEKRESLTKHEDLYAVGSRIKYLVDTTEMIWGCLDSRQYLEAARRFLRAQHVHDLLATSFSSDVLAKFPLLSHQWPLVDKFKKQIVEAAHSTLAAEADLSTQQAADAVVAICALNSMDLQAALPLLLAARRTWLLNQIETSSMATSVEAVAALLSTIAQSIQMTIVQVGELFLSSSQSSDARCMLQSTAKEDELDSSELLFDGHGGAHAAGGGLHAPEAESWQRTSKALHDRLGALSSGQVEKACGAWVRQVSDDLARLCLALLQTCASAESLCQVEAAVCHGIAAWHHPAASASSARGPPTAKPQHTAPGSGQVGAAAAFAANGATPAAAAAPPDFHLESWEAVCQWVLGCPLDLWQEVFQAPFLSRAKELVSCSFAAVGSSLQMPLQQCLAEAAAATPEPAGEASCPHWPFIPTDALGSGSLLPGRAGSGTTNSRTAIAADTSTSTSAANIARSWSEKLSGFRAPKPGAVRQDKGFRQRVQHIRQHFDSELKVVLQSVLLLLGVAEVEFHRKGSWPANNALLRKTSSRLAAAAGGTAWHGSSSSGPAISAHAAELEAYVHQQCSDLAGGIAAGLQRRLEALGAPSDGAAGAATAEQLLLIGRLSSAIANESRYLQVILGAPESWKHHAAGHGQLLRSNTMRSAAAAKLAGSNTRLQAVNEKFMATAITAYKMWANWAASSLAAQLWQQLSEDEILAATTNPLSWSEVVISTGEADSALAEPLQDMRFCLPASPSPSILAFFMAACQEVRRAGDNTVGADALQTLEWELAAAALSTYGALLAPAAALDRRVTEKGVLQLLFDVRLLRDVLAGGRPVNPRSPPAAAPAALAGGSFSSGSFSDPTGLGRMASSGYAEAPDPSVMASVSERKREMAALEQQLQDRLDPIDWATYEPYLWANVQKYYQRVSILFGILIQLQRAHPEGSGKVQTMTETNPLNVLHVVPRFQYLPISAPVALHATNSRSRLAFTPVKSSALAASSSDLAGNFSFADLGSSRAGAGPGAADAGLAAAQQHGAHDAAAGGTSAFSALQARLQAGSLSSLGLMLGDKAAEMTAMAQQRFDNIGTFADYLPTSGLASGAQGLATGLLSSFAKNVGKK